MRKLIAGCLLTLDGVHDAPRSFAGPYFDAAAAEQSLAQLNRSDAMLMGRNTYDYFASAWPNEAGPYPDRVNAIRKYVFSSTLTASEWHNSVLVKDDPVAAITELKREGGGDLVIYGCGQLTQTLLAHDLVDELNVSLYPVIHGSGQSMLRPAVAPQRLTLASVHSEQSGVVSLKYVKA
jgi:dihydrofolate reductase